MVLKHFKFLVDEIFNNTDELLNYFEKFVALIAKFTKTIVD
ncbi:MAG TPA: hypothetical protein P5513_06485 [Candidatus Diapherotrites archaeon]|jgi:hypothetical protein|nr:hypothetical protein [Candidatus Diapherotrites archaeon]